MASTDIHSNLHVSLVGAHSRWYVVPDYRPDGQPSSSATVVNRAGELVATFESLDDAERAVEAVNGRT